MRFNLLNLNQKGGMTALLSVVVLSGIIVTTLTSAYMFVENRAKYNSRIKSAYDTSYVIEDMARNIRQIYDVTLNSGAMTVNPATGVLVANTAACPGNTTPSVMPNMTSGANANILLCVPTNMLFESGFGCTRAPCLCIENAAATTHSIGKQGQQVLDNRYCMTMPAWASNEAPASETMVAEALPTPSHMQKWLARMDQTLDTTIAKETPKVRSSLYAFLGYELKQPTVLGWMLPERAMASSGKEVEVVPAEPTGKGLEEQTIPDNGHIGGGGKNVENEKEDPRIGSGSNAVSVPVGRCNHNDFKNPNAPNLPALDRLCETCTGINCMALNLPNVACKGSVLESQCGRARVNVKFE